MTNIEKLDDELYKAAYGLPIIGDYKEIWSKIKSNPAILREAVKIQKDKFNEKDIVKGLTICDAILTYYEDVDSIAYNSLINAIYANKDIARIVIDGASNGGFSFLLMSLLNPNLKLTESQKEFAVNEAMNKIGTKRWIQKEEHLAQKLNEQGINDDEVVVMDIGGCINPIGQKSGSIYINRMFASLSTEQAHGTGEFDIRYHILRNPNWTLAEKQKLIMDFWADDVTYEECLEQWEWAIVNNSANYKADSDSLFEEMYIYECTYDLLLEFYGDKKITDYIWSEIQFCRQMNEFRPKQGELELKSKRKILA